MSNDYQNGERNNGAVPSRTNGAYRNSANSPFSNDPQRRRAGPRTAQSNKEPMRRTRRPSSQAQNSQARPNRRPSASGHDPGIQTHGEQNRQVGSCSSDIVRSPAVKGDARADVRREGQAVSARRNNNEQSHVTRKPQPATGALLSQEAYSATNCVYQKIKRNESIEADKDTKVNTNNSSNNSHCFKCGAEILHEDLFCPKCGSKVSGDSFSKPFIENKSMIGAAAKKSPKTAGDITTKISNAVVEWFWKYCIIIGVGLILLVVVVIMLSMSSNYEKPIKYLFDGMNKCNSKTLRKAYPKYAFNEVAHAHRFIKRNELDDYLEDRLEDYMEEYEDKFGKNIKITYEIRDRTKIEKSDLEKIQASVASDYAYYQIDKKASVTDGYTVKLRRTFKGKDNKKSDNFTINVYRINGKWYITDLTRIWEFPYSK